jgi:hypothetical protein
MESISDILKVWKDTEEVHRMINETLTSKTNGDPKLKEYRDWIESNIFGFGERSFIYMWKILLENQKTFLEIGVFRGQIVGLAKMLRPELEVTGVTPLDSTDGHWDSDYEKDIKTLHDQFNIPYPTIVKGLSTDQEVKNQLKTYDVVYIDGGHSYEVARHDIAYYQTLVNPGGLLVVDDCSHKYNLPPGYFKGIESVSRAVDELLPNDQFTELFNVMHNRVFKNGNT